MHAHHVLHIKLRHCDCASGERREMAVVRQNERMLTMLNPQAISALNL